MTGILQLDLNAAADEGLLVPFGNKAATAEAEMADPNPAFAPPPVKKRHFGSFLRLRPHHHHHKENNVPDNNEHEKDAQPRAKQAVTFSFPNAPCEFADESEEDKSSEEPVSDGEKETNEERDGEKDVRTHKSHCTVPRANANEQNHSLVENDAFEEKKHEKPMIIEGHGTDPGEDGPVHAVGRFFRRMSRRSDMKTMKIATEDTKDEKTLGESMVHVLQVAVAPEIYGEDEEGEGNLGFYRRVNKGPKPSEERAVRSATLQKKEVTRLKALVKTLKAKIGKLEEDLKTKELEASSWKLRAQELEKQLKRQNGEADDSDDESAADDGRNGDSEIDHEWAEDGSTSAKEGMLVDTNIEPEKVEFDPLKAKQKDAPTKDDDEDLDILTTFVTEAIQSMDEDSPPDTGPVPNSGDDAAPEQNAPEIARV